MDSLSFRWGIPSLLCAVSVILMIHVPASAQEHEVIADSIYYSFNWDVFVMSEFGGSEMHEQRIMGGNPGAFRYMKHTLPAPPGPDDLTKIEVAHVYIWSYSPIGEGINCIEYSEDIRLLNLPWQNAFVTSAPLISQGGKLYRATEFISVIGDTTWTSGSLPCLSSTDFIALDGSDTHPNFSEGLLNFGFWRVHTRGFSQPPIPDTEDLIYEHGSDNFTVTLHLEPPANTPPAAFLDNFMYLDYFFNSLQRYPVLANDMDFDGDSIWITDVGQPGEGVVHSFTRDAVTYSLGQSSVPDGAFTTFEYEISDGLDSSESIVFIYFCVCPVECFPLLNGGFVDSVSQHNTSVQRSMSDTLDVDLFRRLRDEYLSPDATGTEMIDFYYRMAPELMPLFLLQRPDIGHQAYRVLDSMQAPLENLLDGDGSMLISQSLVDSVNNLIDSLIIAVSDTLRDSILVRLQSLCPLEDMVGITVAEAAAGIFCDSMPSSVIEHSSETDDPATIVPNPFHTTTRITYRLLPEKSDIEIDILDSQGRHIRSLMIGKTTPGEHISVNWDGRDERGNVVSSGMYFVRLQAANALHMDRIILVR